jgi:hypothetical protein
MASVNRPPAPQSEGVHDRDLDPPRARRTRASARVPSIHDYQRLVANPFLAVFGVIVWLAALRQTTEMRRLDLFCFAVAGLALIVPLFQCHCLDCGGTQRLTRWRTHRCERVEARRLAGRPRRFRGPTPPTQTVLWFYALLAVGALSLILLS